MRVSTIYLAKPIGPGGTTWVKGYVTKHTALGVTLCQYDDGRDGGTFYPAHMIEQIKLNTGW